MLMLPEKGPELVRALDNFIARGKETLDSLVPEWIMTRAFLRGVRGGELVEERASTGEGIFTFLSEDNQLLFRNEELLRYYQVELGRFLSIDVRPAISMLGWGLGALRKSSIGQVVLDHEVGVRTVSRIKSSFMEQLLQVGCSALGGWVEEAGILSGKSIIEVINPAELIPIPFNARTPQQAQGLIRDRWVSLQWLKTHTTLWDKVQRRRSEMNIREVDWGAMEEAAEAGDVHGGVIEEFASAFRRSAEAGYGAKGDGKLATIKEGRLFVRLTEVWLTTEEGLVRRYIVKIGDLLPEDQKYEDEGRAVYLPIGIARYYQYGFYGRSYVTPLIPFAVESERALEAIFQSLRDLDSLGFLTVPTSLGIDDEDFEADARPKRVWYNPDPLQPQMGIGQIRPHTLGTLPQQGMGIASEYMKRLGGQSEMFQGGAPGRTDSMVGFNYLKEQNDVGVMAPGESIADCFTTVYSAILASSKSRLTRQDMIHILDLDSMTVGVVLNEDGSLNLTRNPIPDPEEIKIDIKSRTPPSRTQRIQDLMTMLQAQVIDHRQFRLINYREGLGLPVGNEGEYQNWRKIRLNIRRLFGDGETPSVEWKDVAVEINADDPEMCLLELTAFMASPEYSLGHESVKIGFKHLREAYDGMLGNQPPLPEFDEIGMGASSAPPGAEGVTEGGM